MAKILIVDDSAVIRDLLTEFLSEAGHFVEAAEDGNVGLEKARAGDYHLCICDLHLPGRNGYQLLTELGSDRGNMQFVFTDSLPDGLYQQIQETTPYLCLRKPFDLEQLRRIIQRALEQVESQ
jgi:CheY-like chemotaxis protein